MKKAFENSKAFFILNNTVCLQHRYFYYIFFALQNGLIIYRHSFAIYKGNEQVYRLGHI